MWALYLGNDNYTRNDVVYLQSVPQEVKRGDEDFIKACGKFLVSESREELYGFQVRNVTYKKAPDTNISGDYSNKIILVKRYKNIGDVIGTISACEILKKNNPTCKIIFACSDYMLDFIKLFPCVDEVMDYLDSRKIEKFTTCDILIDFIHTVEDNEKRKTTDYYDLYKERLGEQFKDEPIILPKIDLNRCNNIDTWMVDRDLIRDKFIILHTGGSSPLRKWNNEKWRALASEIARYTDYSIVVTGSAYDYFFEDTKNKIYSAVGMSLTELPLLIDNSHLVVSTDTGILHLAGILEKKCVSLFGNTKPSSVASYYKNQYTITGTCDYNEPCFTLRLSECPYVSDVSKCMKSISVSDVVYQIKHAGVKWESKLRTIKEIVKSKTDNIYSSVLGRTYIDLKDIDLRNTGNNILYITQSEYKAYSGGRYYGWMNAKLLAKMGFNVWVLTNKLPPFYNDFSDEYYSGKFTVVIDEGLHHESLDCKFNYVIGEPYSTGKMAVDYGKRTGAVILNYIYETPNFIREYRKGDDTNEGFWTVHKQALIDSDVIMPLSELGKEKLIEWDIIFKDKTIIPIEPTINEPLAKDIKLNRYVEPEHDFCFISMNKNYKNLKMFLTSLAGTIPNCSVALIGNSVTNTANSLTGIPLKIQCFENCSDKVKFNVLYKSKVLVCPSSFEGFGMTVIEGIFRGKKIVACDLPITRLNVGGYPEYFKADNVNSLVKALKLAKLKYTKEGRQSYLVSEGYKIYKSKYSHEATFTKLSNIFNLLEPGKVIDDIHVGVMTPYNEKCGIAENTKFYLQQLSPEQYEVLAPSGGRISCEDGKEVTRLWDRNFSSYEQLYNHIYDSKINIIHLQHEFSFFKNEVAVENLYRFLKKLKIIGIKVIITYHTYFFDKGIIDTLNSIVDHVTVCNYKAYLKIKELSKNVKVSCTYLPVLEYPKVKVTDAKEKLRKLGLEISDEDNYIGVHGFWHRHKGYHLVVRAFSELLKERPNLRLLFIGSYDEKNQYAFEIKHLLKSLNIYDKVIIANSYLPMDRVIDYLQCCDVVAYPYLIEGYYSASAAIRTGLSAHVPVIASNSPMFQDLEKLIPISKMGDVTSLKNAIDKILNYKPVTITSKILEQDKYIKNMTPKKIANMHVSLYKKVLKE